MEMVSLVVEYTILLHNPLSGPESDAKYKTQLQTTCGKVVKVEIVSFQISFALKKIK